MKFFCSSKLHGHDRDYVRHEVTIRYRLHEQPFKLKSSFIGSTATPNTTTGLSPNNNNKKKLKISNNKRQMF